MWTMWFIRALYCSTLFTEIILRTGTQDSEFLHKRENLLLFLKDKKNEINANKKNYNMILSCYKKGRATVFTDINF